MHEFPNDFYGEKLKIILLGEIRQMTTFKTKRKLIGFICVGRLFFRVKQNIYIQIMKLPIGKLGMSF